MPTWKELEREVALGDGESVTGVLDPQGQVDKEIRDGRPIYIFHLLVDGEPAVVSGGKRLKNAFLVAGARGFDKPTRVKITAHGAARSFDRFYTVEVIR